MLPDGGRATSYENVDMALYGYVLESVRLGQSNSPYTASPDTYISNQTTFDLSYPSDESAARTEYHVFVLEDGRLPDAVFAWTKNEGAIQDGAQIPFRRFDYDGRDGRFRTLSGGPVAAVGVLTSDANTTRLSVIKPVLTDLVSYPIRVSIGAASGQTFGVALVPLDSNLNSPDPAAGTVQISLESGDLGWNSSDLSTYEGSDVRFQQQAFFEFSDSTGRLGTVGDVLLLNPMPVSGQIPLVRIGFDSYLTAIMVATEAGFTSPTSGTFQWAANTGRLNLSLADIAASPGQAVYYDGVAFSDTSSISSQARGTVASPTNLSPIPPEASDLFFRAGSHQFATTRWVDTFGTTPKGTVDVRRSNGAIQFSASDVLNYGSESLIAYIGELTLERGIRFRTARTPVDPGATNDTLQDAKAFYVTESAVYADPIIESPYVLLPAIPASSEPYTVKVQQGTGSYTNDDLPRLDVASPPTGIGYVLDTEERQLVFAERRENSINRPYQPYGALQLAPLLLSSPSVALETSPNSGTFASLVEGEDFVVERQSGLVSFTTTDGSLVLERSGGIVSGTTFQDGEADFSSVLPGDSVIILSGLAVGVYTVASQDSITQLTLETPAAVADSGLSYEIRRGYEILANRYFQEVLPVDPNTKVERLTFLGVSSNSPRLSINPAYIPRTRFRLGSDVFPTVVTVPTNGDFTSLSSGTIEVSLDTGDLNFSTSDFGLSVYESREQVLGSDYSLQPVLGFISFTERFLENEEVFITYVNVDSNGIRTIIEERGRFLVRKEESQPHPFQTSTVSFNPSGRELAGTPIVRVFRGGRPQQDTQQVQINYSASTVTFVESLTVTDALPSGPTLQPEESVLIDYYVYGALGGEKDVSVISPPMAGADFAINAEETTFQLLGDRSSEFVPDSLLRIDNAAVYLIGSVSVSYDASLQSDVTTITLSSNQEFRDDYLNPPLDVSSGATPLVPVGNEPPYFVTVVEPFQTIPRGGTILRVAGDDTLLFPASTVLLFQGPSILDFSVVEGASFNSDTGYTEITLSAGVSRQYDTSTVVLRRSTLPVFAGPVSDLRTSRVPTPELSLVVFRQIDGEAGSILVSPEDYEIDDSGRIVLTTALRDDETIGVFYTGASIIEGSRGVQASYTYMIAPSADNGLLGQVLRADYTTYIPDSYYFRVETYTNLQAEMAQQFEDSAKGSTPSGGPILENTSEPQLHDQGVESLYFTERRLANEDTVSRATLKTYNDSVNFLEHALRDLDGRVVGDHDGLFLFDGNIDNPTRISFDQVTNQIDDTFKVSPAPYTTSFSGGLFQITSLGTYEAVYKPSPTSRFFPTTRASSTGIGTDTGNGDVIGDLKFSPVTGVTSMETRRSFAMLTRDALTGETLLYVDDADGSAENTRPSFSGVTQVKIIDRSGTLLDGPLGMGSFTATSITLSDPLTADIPLGATVQMADSDPNFQRLRPGFDVGVDSDRGLLVYLETVPVFFENNPPPAGSAVNSVFGAQAPSPEPERFPALDGQTLDDDGDIRFPLLTPDPNSEIGVDVGLLTREEGLIGAGGLIPLNTTAPLLTTVNIAAPDVVTLVSGVWPSDFQEGDLIRTIGGVNGQSDFYRIESVLSTTSARIDGSLSTDTNVPAVVAYSSSLESGTGTFVIDGPYTRLTDAAATFITNNIISGHTVVIDVGLSKIRRQVVNVLSETELLISGSYTAVVGYRVTNPLSTFGTTNEGYYGDLLSVLSAEKDILLDNTSPVPSETNATDDFFSTVLTTTGSGTQGSTNSGSDVFEDLTKDFYAEDLAIGDFIRINTSPLGGFHEIAEILSPTQLRATESFSANSSGVSYSLERTSLASVESLQAVFDVWFSAQTASSDVSDFLLLLSTVNVSGDLGAVARPWLTSDLTSRSSEVSSRIAYVPTLITGLENVLSTGDNFYDRRFVWIDARINQESGLIVRQERAVANRIAKQAQILKDLLKMLSA